ncbi:hypothetical protein BKA56DRAFT_29945 [Ilyonectria sp. MPI-CAGE-AT-0026]|nr:hypothetical protein BKA56DRAFT_29945 [Ilyonectria sp. MPI-CAGE-AT-0026]
MDRTLLHRFCFVHRSAIRDDMLVTQWKASAASMRRRVASFTNQDQRRLPSRSPRKCRYWDSPTWGKATKQGTRLAIRRQCCCAVACEPGRELWGEGFVVSRVSHLRPGSRLAGLRRVGLTEMIRNNITNSETRRGRRITWKGSSVVARCTRREVIELVARHLNGDCDSQAGDFRAEPGHSVFCRALTACTAAITTSAGCEGSRPPMK